MIERKFVAQKLKERQVQEYVAQSLTKAGHCRVEIKRTPMGEKIIVYTTRPGLIVGRKGENIKKLTNTLKKKFNLENPQIEIGDIENPLLDAGAVADSIAYTFERFGPKRFKFIGYDMLTKIMDAGALGAEIVIGGRGVPG
ncbi:MAG: 30S ribosomal protein S3, partial [Candidatus Nanoarchaeia archaeon]